MRFNIALATLALSVTYIAIICQASNIYVSPLGDDSNSGTSSSDALETIQAAVNKVSSGAIIYLMKGVYTSDGNIGILISKNLTITSYDVKNVARISCGSYTKPAWTFDADAMISSLSFSGCATALYLSSGSVVINNSSFVANSNMRNSVAVEAAGTVHSLTVSNCYFESTQLVYGQWGIVEPNTRLVITDTEFNGAYLDTGAIDVTYVSKVVLTNVLIQNVGSGRNSPVGVMMRCVNQATFDEITVRNHIGYQPVWLQNVSLSMDNSMFTNNSNLNWYGGHIMIENPWVGPLNKVSISNTQFKNSTRTVYGGAMSLQDCKVVIDDSDFSYNSASNTGGVFWLWSNVQLNVFSSKFYSNSATTGAIFGCTQPGMAYTSDCIFENNTEKNPSDCTA